MSERGLNETEQALDDKGTNVAWTRLDENVAEPNKDEARQNKTEWSKIAEPTHKNVGSANGKMSASRP